MPSPTPTRFDAPASALVLFAAAILPQFFVSILWWPFAALLLFAALVLSIVGLCQGRVLGGVLMLMLVCLGGPMAMVVAPSVNALALARAAKGRRETTPVTATAPAAPAPELASSPAPAIPPAQSFAAAVAASQRRAAALYPALGQINSPLNLRFRMRLDDWRGRGDIRLSRPDWPEQLAAECAAGTSSVANR